MEYFDKLADGWTIYVWLAAGVMIIIAVIVAMRWAYKNNQFDEDIKYLVFDENDRDKMSPADFAKSREVLKDQIRQREEHLRARAERERGGGTDAKG